MFASVWSDLKRLLAGTMQYAELKPELPASFFTAPRNHQTIGKPLGDGRLKRFPSFKKIEGTVTDDESFDDDVNDQDLLEMGNIVTTRFLVSNSLDSLQLILMVLLPLIPSTRRRTHIPMVSSL